MNDVDGEITVYDDGKTSIVFYPLTGAVSIKKKYKNRVRSYILVEEDVKEETVFGYKVEQSVYKIG